MGTGWPKKARGKVIRAKDIIVGAVERGMDTVTGKAVIDEVVKFAQETEAVNTAIVTRIYQILDRQARLEEKLMESQAKYKRISILLILSLVWSALWTVAIAYIWARKK